MKKEIFWKYLMLNYHETLKYRHALQLGVGFFTICRLQFAYSYHYRFQADLWGFIRSKFKLSFFKLSTIKAISSFTTANR